MGFQRRNLPRHYRARQLQLLRYRREAPQFRHPKKEMHGIKSVHCCNFSNKHLLIVVYLDIKREAKVQASNQEADE